MPAPFIMKQWIPKNGPEETLYKLAHKANEMERHLVDMQEQFDLLDDVKKEFFASIVDGQAGKSTAEKERAALISQEWKDWMTGYMEAKASYLKAKVKRNVAVRNWETCRSIMSSLRTERNTST